MKMTGKVYTRAKIKYLLEEAGWNMAELSEKHGLFRTACSNALREPWPRVERIIADAIGVAPEVIWPERYNEKGKPLVSPLSRRRRIA
ncbi:MAG: helix-turn-helix domain-containing protein [Nitrospirae bacterium]|nr:helix-turn-helix domain-containing protein [Magnetococcales bacterium]HAT50779.1 DNA-binding protein [Alphaproteobacteria bacterium]